MASSIDATKPADNVQAMKSDLRANFLAAKNEITALQADVAAIQPKVSFARQIAFSSSPMGT